MPIEPADALIKLKDRPMGLADGAIKLSGGVIETEDCLLKMAVESDGAAD
jgi:hypothetical protein